MYLIISVLQLPAPTEFFALILYLCCVFAASPVCINVNSAPLSTSSPSTRTSYPVAPDNASQLNSIEFEVDTAFIAFGDDGNVQLLT